MCGRYLVVTDDDYEEIENIVNEISDKYREAGVVNGEAFPTNNVPVIYSHNGRNILSAAKWGFPGFKNNGVIINARAETVHEKPMFRSAFVSKRCILPANGYYEWLAEGGRKTRYFIRVKDKRLFFMAGLYNMFADKNGIVYPAVTIITTSANPDIAFIHDRMPAILADDAVKTWLDKSNTDPGMLRSLLMPYGSGKMEYKAG